MDFGNLLNRALSISWKHKTLWVLGFFAASIGAFGGIENQLPDKADKWFMKIDPGLSESVVDWFEINPGVSIALVLFIIAAVLALALIFFVLGLISIAGLVEGVNRIEEGKAYTLGQLFREGALYFWRFLGLFFIFFAIGIVCVIMLVLPIVLAFVVTGVFGLLVLLIAIPIGIAAIFFFGNIYGLAQREIVIYQTPVFEAISEGYSLLVKHLGSNIIIFLIETFLWIAIMITGLILIAVFAIPVVLIGYHSTLWLVLILLLTVPIFIFVAIVIEGFLGTFFNSLFTLFFMELRKLTPRDRPDSGAEVAVSQV
jgi:hypothetical protein